MPVTAIIAILVSVTMSAVAQIALKTGMAAPAMKTAIGSGQVGRIALAVITQPYVLLGLAIYGAGVLIWLYVLTMVDVSKAYPFVSLGFIVTMILAATLLGETITPIRIAGTLVVCFGVFLVAQR
jgi:drug/metabolite transporter (DMT)-like permease